ncbi:MAG: hypothetical protein EZS28_008878 [Streblomastix strix]|uniref:Uncharacterized protein n=1 Tax=Streblomastix strix TaxID=222440 RepID=A0A5J4WLT8_9EUKA|nr:MAG: hypothetical protein EZS28_008878 [Streblomastix strix]
MLVSSFISQSQLQQIREIALDKSKGYVFATTDEMNTQMKDQENVAKLAARDNLYIVDKQVMDYWWDGSSLRALETELPDMSNVMTILGTATGGVNAITDLSFDGNTLISDKNCSFVKINFDKTIKGQKTFNITIHSVGISTQDDALLLLKADKTQLIDAYNKTEVDDLLDDKLNISDQIDAYNKTEVDALLDDKLNVSDQIDAYNKSEVDALLDDKLNISNQIDAYNKSEVDALLDDKLNISDQIDAYNKTEVDALHDDKLNVSDQIDAYTKTAIDALLDNKLNISDQIDAYSKQEDDALLLLKADKTELADYVDLTSAQTITGQKQFGIVSVSSISKLNKNCTSILLAFGGEMLVSSLVSQPQLQEVRDIALDKSKGYVFATTDEMNTWMEDQENVAKLAIGNNLYIIDKQVMDNWWDGTGLRALETELPDMSNVMIILGTATRGVNAITGLSFDGYTLISDKNCSFVKINFDETIKGQKTFNITIHSFGIIAQYQDYNSVV